MQDAYYTEQAKWNSQGNRYFWVVFREQEALDIKVVRSSKPAARSAFTAWL
jgi:hypothetical protein